MEATPQIFLCYAREDEAKVEELYQKLSDAGFKPWMAKKDLLPGEQWKSRIPQAIRGSDFFVVCLSATSVNKRSFIQTEIRNALDVWREKLDSDIYLIPVRLEDCEAPESLRDFHWVNLFEKDGWTRLVGAIHVGMERREKAIKPVVQESTPFESHPTREKPSPGTDMAMPEEGSERIRSEKLTISEESRMHNTAEEFYEQGMKHFQKGEWQEASNWFIKTLTQDATHADAIAKLQWAQEQQKLEALYTQGEKHLANGNWPEAIEAFSEVVNLDRSYRNARRKLEQAKQSRALEALYEEGMRYFHGEEWQKAIDALEKVEQADAGYDVSAQLKEARKRRRLEDLYEEGIAYMRKEEWTEALGKFEEVHRLDPNYEDVVANREEARKQREKQVDLSTLYGKATGYERAKDWEEAKETYLEILAIDSTYKDVAKRVETVGRQIKLQDSDSSREPFVPAWWRSLSIEVRITLLSILIGALVTMCAAFVSSPLIEPIIAAVFAPIKSTPTATLTPMPTETLTPTVMSSPTHTPTITPTSTSSPTATLPSTSHTAPALVSPDEGTPFPEGQDVKLVWEWEQDLAENEYFEVRIRLEGEREFDQIDLTKELYRIVSASELTQPGTYEWQVAIVSLSGEEKGVSQIRSFVVQ